MIEGVGTFKSHSIKGFKNEDNREELLSALNVNWEIETMILFFL